MDAHNPDDIKRFAKAFRFMGEAYSEAVSTLKVDAYFQILEPYPIELVEKAIFQTCREVQAFKVPPCAEIVNRIVGTQNERAENAFAICVRNSCFDRSVEFEDSAISIAIERTAGGWEQWCEWVRFMPEAEFQWKKKDWLKHYAQNCNAPVLPPKRFVGYLEQMQSLRGDCSYGPVVTRVALNGAASSEPIKALAAVPDQKQLEAGAVSGEELDQLLEEARKVFDSKKSLQVKPE
jgi:hypothetical protein